MHIRTSEPDVATFGVKDLDCDATPELAVALPWLNVTFPEASVSNKVQLTSVLGSRSYMTMSTCWTVVDRSAPPRRR